VIYDVAIVGAGLHGLSTAWNLAGHSVVVLEQFKLGHHRGSSHGATRITRSSYADAAYVELMRVTRTEDWPRLERDAGARLIARCDGAFFGPRGGLFDAFASQSYGDDVELLSRERARKRFPELTFPDSPEVLIDRTAGVIDAEATMAALARTIRGNGVTIVEECAVESWTTGEPIEIATSRGVFRAHRLVITAGPWANKLLGLPLRPVRQTVGFFRCAPPLFVHLGATSDELHYGLPSRDTFKAARHASLGNDDPDVVVEADARALTALEAFLAEHLSEPPGPPVSAETCFFTMSPREDFVLDLVEPRIAVGAGFSGHGFKLGPTSGRILAELVMTGRTSVEPFERRRSQFAIG
jgi:sarcosine oxidase